MITLCGGCHPDRQMLITDAARKGRTNPGGRIVRLGEAVANIVRLGGVVANMARHLGGAHSAGMVHVIGIKPASTNHHDNKIERPLDEAELPNTLIPLEGEAPEYVAVIDANGELVI